MLALRVGHLYLSVRPFVRATKLDVGASNSNQNKREQKSSFHNNRIRGHGPLFKQKKKTKEMAI